ncbi:DUF58 domain-containing protein [bacterium]|nr:DUF58 domain-containing protein [bacterium]
MITSETKNWLKPETLSKLSGLDLIARRVVEGYITGLHKSPYHGFSAEFSEHHPYHPGAPLKSIDWRVLGRTERYYIKSYEEETNCRAMLIMDTSASMGYSSGAISKQLYATYLAAALAFLLLKQRDATGLALVDSELRTLIRPRSVMSHLSTLLTPLSKLESRGKTRLAPVLNKLAERLKRRTLICLFSDLMDSDKEVITALKNFRIRGHELLVFHILDPMEINMQLKRDAILIDMETDKRLPVDTRHIARTYADQVDAWTQKLRHSCLNMQVDYIRLSTDTPYDQALSAFLAKRKKSGA